MKVFIILRGVPGSGKNYFISHALPKSAIICSADDYFFNILGKGVKYIFNPSHLGTAHAWCFGLFNNALDAEVPLIVLNNTNILLSHYAHYVQHAKEHGYESFQKVCNGNFQNIHNVPLKTVEKMKQKFEIDYDLPEWRNK